MENVYKNIASNHKVRFYGGQKARFREFIIAEFNKLGYADIHVDSNKNVIIGDADNAETVYSAHYDTPMISPYVTPFTRVFGHIIGSIIANVAVLALSAFFCIAFGEMLKLVGLQASNGSSIILVCPILILSLTFIIPNPNNANDNTSGIIAVYRIAKRLKESGSEKGAAFILFNLEEFGLIGSKAYKNQFFKIHNRLPQFLLVNFDCVGLGDRVLIAYSSPKSKSYAQRLSTCFARSITKKANPLIASDNLSFPNAIMLATVGRPLLGEYYLPAIHMPYDKKINLKTIDAVCEGVLSTVNASMQTIFDVKV